MKSCGRHTSRRPSCKVRPGVQQPSLQHHGLELDSSRLSCPGLDKYTPAESKSPRGLTRFPNRNKFIAEFIYKETGETRTAKQVGSRIQQLRDTAAGKTSESRCPSSLAPYRETGRSRIVGQS